MAARFRRLALGLGLVAALAIPACNQRIPVNPSDDMGPPAADGALPDRLVLPDQPVITWDAAVPQLCRTEPPGFRHVTDPHGSFVLALPKTVKVHPLTIAKRRSGESAVALTVYPVAGLAVSRPLFSPMPPLTDASRTLKDAFEAALAASGLGSLTAPSAGVESKSPDGFSDIKEITWRVQSNSHFPADSLRPLLAAALLGRQVTEITGDPHLVPTITRSVEIRLTLVLRKDTLAISAALADAGSLARPDSGAFAWIEDLSNGSALFRPGSGSSTSFHCAVQRIKSTPMADVIWVSDESGSMNDNRQDVVNNATTFFNRAQAAGLDFRMGVTGVKKPAPGSPPGKFCSVESADRYHDGGEDRFLLPTEKDIFKGCIVNPPFYEGGEEYGLTGAYHAVMEHLPRGSEPGKIRPGAHLAVIILTDEAPHELKPGGDFQGHGGFLSSTDYKGSSCTLAPHKSQMLDDFLKPFKQLFSGKGPHGAESRATVHLIGGGCNSSCSADNAYGYKELASLTGGRVGDICQKNLASTLQIIINSIAATASGIVLDRPPVTSTLRIALDGKIVPRHPSTGFMFHAAGRSLTFHQVPVRKGQQIVAAFRHFDGAK